MIENKKENKKPATELGRYMALQVQKIIEVNEARELELKKAGEERSKREAKAAEERKQKEEEELRKRKELVLQRWHVPLID